MLAPIFIRDYSVNDTLEEIRGSDLLQCSKAGKSHFHLYERAQRVQQEFLKIRQELGAVRNVDDLDDEIRPNALIISPNFGSQSVINAPFSENPHTLDPHILEIPCHYLISIDDLAKFGMTKPEDVTLDTATRLDRLLRCELRVSGWGEVGGQNGQADEYRMQCFAGFLKVLLDRTVPHREDGTLDLSGGLYHEAGHILAGDTGSSKNILLISQSLELSEKARRSTRSPVVLFSMVVLFVVLSVILHIYPLLLLALLIAVLFLITIKNSVDVRDTARDAACECSRALNKAFQERKEKLRCEEEALRQQLGLSVLSSNERQKAKERAADKIRNENAPFAALQVAAALYRAAQVVDTAINKDRIDRGSVTEKELKKEQEERTHPSDLERIEAIDRALAERSKLTPEQDLQRRYRAKRERWLQREKRKGQVLINVKNH